MSDIQISDDSLNNVNNVSNQSMTTVDVDNVAHDKISDSGISDLNTNAPGQEQFTPTFNKTEFSDRDTNTPFTAIFTESNDKYDVPITMEMNETNTGDGVGPSIEVNDTEGPEERASSPPLQSGRYFISSEINRQTVTWLLDTGASVSIVPPSFKKLGSVVRIRTPFYLGGFSPGKTGHKITEKIKLDIDFVGARLVGYFYICPTNHPMIGTDYYRLFPKFISLDTRDTTLTIKGKRLLMDRNPEEAVSSFTKRKNNHFEPNKKQNNDTLWARVRNNVIVPPSKCAMVNMTSRIRHGEPIFLSLFDDDEDERVFIQSEIVSPENGQFQVTVENKGDKPLYLYQGKTLGRMVWDGDEISSNTVCVFTTEEVAEVVKGIKQENASNTKTDNIPIPVSEIMERDKLENDEFDGLRERGISIDLQIPTPTPDVGPEGMTEPDILAEEEKSKTCPYWPKEDGYLQRFDYSSMDQPTEGVVRDMLTNYQQVWQNERFPEQFRKGISIEPIKMELKDGAPPFIKHKPRRMNEEKLKYMRKHIETMLQQGVIEELQEPSAYTSPAMIVLEERYMASEKKNVFKSRLVIDGRAQNQWTKDLIHPLPLTDEFRRKLTQEGYTIFTNLDLCSAFYQVPLDQPSARRLFGFTALGRVYFIKRLSMGNKNSPALMQCIMEKVFKCHPRAWPYLDDLTIHSRSVEEHIQDLRLALALCSKYNILLSPKKADLFRSEARILGFRISHNLQSLSSEKYTKIEQMKFPEDKKAAVSAAAFFSYFLPLSSRLSELMAPLRRLARPKEKYKELPGDRESFQELKTHLMNPDVGAIRTPSDRPEHDMVIFTDASATSLAALICQMLPPLPNNDLDPTRNYLSIVGCWSRQLDASWVSYPIWLKELMSLQETTEKFRHLLWGRRFFVFTDSKTVKSWCSLERIPVDLTRRVLRLQEFNYRIIFIESRCNPSDWLTRVMTTPIEGTYTSFVENKIINANGIALDHRELFTKAKCEEITNFFTCKRRQQLSRPADSDEIKSTKFSSTEEVDDALEGPQVFIQRDNIDSGYGIKESDEIFQPSTGCGELSIAALGLNDREIDDGHEERLTDTEIDEDMCAPMTLEWFESQPLKRILKMQEENVIKKIKQAITDNWEPSKTEALLAEQEMRQYLLHKSNFKISYQGILFRVWINAKGIAKSLIVVGPTEYDKLVNHAHSSPYSGNRHVGQRKTFTLLNKKYFAFNARQRVNRIVTQCPICKLNNYTRSAADKTGNHISTKPNQVGSIDLIGPLFGFARTASGNSRTIFTYVDHHTRYCFATTIQTTSDDAFFNALQKLRHALSGFPSKLVMDNQLARKDSNSEKFLTSLGVEILHGHPRVSRCQARVERTIGTLTRLLCRLHTENPSTAFETLVQESTLIINSSPSDGLADDKSPRELHFSVSPSNFLIHEGMDNKKIQTAKMASRETLLNDVKRYMRQTKSTDSPTNYTIKLQVGDLVMRKRTSFPAHSPKKLAFKLKIEAYRVKSKIATNTYRCESILTGEEIVSAGDNLLRVKNINEDELRGLIRAMEEVARKNDTGASLSEGRTLRRRR